MTITDSFGYNGVFNYAATTNYYGTWLNLGFSGSNTVLLGDSMTSPPAAAAPAPAPANPNCITLYDQCNYEGKSKQICQNTPNLTNVQWTGPIKSVKIPANMTMKVYQSNDYLGQSYSLKGDQACLDQSQKVYALLQSMSSLKFKKPHHKVRGLRRREGHIHGVSMIQSLGGVVM